MSKIIISIATPTAISTISLPSADVWALAQFLKRLSFDQARACAASDDEAYQIILTTEALRDLLREVGFAPR